MLPFIFLTAFALPTQLSIGIRTGKDGLHLNDRMPDAPVEMLVINHLEPSPTEN